MNKYTLIDSGSLKKLEAFGDYKLVRPCQVAVWKNKVPLKGDMSFSREEDQKWHIDKKPPSFWTVAIGKLRFKLELTDFGHIGVFPEHSFVWEFLDKHVKKGQNILNLFAYTGGATFACAKKGAKIVHLDSSKKAIAWAKENAKLNQLENAPIRYILDDVKKFLKKEIKRNHKYHGIILDPPTFGRGAKNEVFKIEKDISQLLDLCKKVLIEDPEFMVFTCHSPGFSPIVLENLLSDLSFKGKISSSELVIKSKNSLDLPFGSVAIYTNEKTC